MEVEKIGSCVVIHMNFGENRLSPEFVKAFHEALDQAEAYEDAKSVVTIGEGKYYSLGLDLDGMAKMSTPELMQLGSDIQKLLARLLTFPLVTVAAINGHIYAAGVFIALAQDYMVMRTGRGWFCLPEINLKRNFAVGYLRLAKARLPPTQWHAAIILGKRYTAEEAEATGIVHEVSSLERLKDSAIAAANRLAGEGLDRKTLAVLKHDLYRDTYQALVEPVRVARVRTMDVEKIGSCVVIHMNFGENRLSPEFLKAFHEALDQAEAYEDAKCVVTIGEGKYYSLGLDLDGMMTKTYPEILQTLLDVQKLLARLLTFPLVTVAAINGHVYAAGACVALALDYRVMRTDRGWFRLPEIELRRNFPVGLLEFVKARLPPSEHVVSIVLGKRYTAEEAQAAGIVHEVSSLERLKDSAIAAANRLAGEGLDRNTLAALKYDLHQDVYKALKEPIRFYSQL